MSRSAGSKGKQCNGCHPTRERGLQMANTTPYMHERAIHTTAMISQPFINNHYQGVSNCGPATKVTTNTMQSEYSTDKAH